MTSIFTFGFWSQVFVFWAVLILLILGYNTSLMFSDSSRKHREEFLVKKR